MGLSGTAADFGAGEDWPGPECSLEGVLGNPKLQLFNVVDLEREGWVGVILFGWLA